MNKLFCFVGDNTVPYRTIMSEHKDFYISDVLIRKSQVVIAEQTHSNNVHICKNEDSGAGFDDHPQIQDCDALITNLPDQFLLIRTADCTPVLLYDEKTKSIGAVHSGREGTSKNIVGATVAAMNKAYSVIPSNLKCYIGAGICKNHYKLNEATFTLFTRTCLDAGIKINLDDFPAVDIQNAIVQQLIQAGIRAKNIESNDICTFESSRHYSYRRDGTNNRQINLIGMIYGKHSL
jgi:polyphenol oxidase